MYNSLSTYRNAVDRSIRADINIIRYEYEIGAIRNIVWIPGSTSPADPATKKDIALTYAVKLMMHSGVIPFYFSKADSPSAQLSKTIFLWLYLITQSQTALMMIYFRLYALAIPFPIETMVPFHEEGFPAIAGWYSNDVVGRMSYLICVYHGLDVHLYVYHDAPCLKGLLDSHFSVMKRWVDKYNREKKSDYDYPTERITDLKHKDGLPNNIFDLICNNCLWCQEINKASRKVKYVHSSRSMYTI